MAQWLWQLKWALVAAIFIGPVWAYFSYKDSQRIEHVMHDGAAYVATVREGYVQHHRRGPDEYSLQLVWSDESGFQAQTVHISSAFADQVFQGDQVVIETAEIRYLASETDGPVVVAADGVQQIEDKKFDMWFGIIAAIAGLILTPIAFIVERNSQKKQDDDIDAELARIRAKNAGPV